MVIGQTHEGCITCCLPCRYLIREDRENPEPAIKGGDTAATVGAVSQHYTLSPEPILLNVALI
jgi:hypothetical protein